MKPIIKEYFDTFLRNLCLLILLAFNISILNAQSTGDVMSISKLTSPIIMDGKVDEAAWLKINPLPVNMHLPNFKGQLTEKTEMRIAYDDQFIYFSTICYDSEPAKIQTPSFQRDDWEMNMDLIGFALDTYDDNENMLIFSVTASGSRVDVAIKNDAQGDDATNTSWNSYWSAETTINEKGWQTELKVPFSSLRFNVENGEIKMGLTAWRLISRKREMHQFPAIPPDWGFWSFVKASQSQTVSFKDVKNNRPWYVSPYILSGLGHHHEENDLDEQIKINDKDLEVGLDVQHAFSDNLNADFTINTDFAQVEADDQVVNLSRFSLFLPEKRRFFLERASVFDFKNDLNNNLFYSRRIGISDSERVPILGGVRLVGRLNNWDVGVLNMQSRKVSDIASENFGVLRLRKNVFNQRSYIGGMFTSRLDTEGYKNFAYGVDGIFNLFNQDYLQVNLAQTYDSEDDNDIKFMDKSRIYVMWEKRIINGLGYKFSYSNVGNDYNPGLGFERRKNFTQIGDKLFYSWFAPENSNLQQTTITLNGEVSFNNFSDKLETSTIGIDAKWNWNRGSSFGINIERFRDVVPEAFDLSDDITINPADFSNTTSSISFGTPEVNMTNFKTNVKIGTFYGGNLVSFGFNPKFVFSKYFQLSGSYEFNNIKFPDLDETLKAHVARISMKSSLNVKLSMSAFAQINTLDNISAINFRLRYNPVDGNDLYLVYNEILNNNPRSRIPMLPSSEARAIMVKYIHTFRL